MKGYGFRGIFLGCLLAVFFVCLPPAALAQTAGQYEKSIRELEHEEALRERITREETEPQVPKEEPPAVVEEEGERVFVRKIIVTGVTVFSENRIREIVEPYEGSELSLRDIYGIADSISDLYRQKDYLTSRAYVPPQDLTDGVLEIRVLEGKMGGLTIEGNRYFSDRLLQRKFHLQKGDHFDYRLLRKSLVKINEHPDRTARSVLIPGAEPGQTDIILKVEDRRPYHFGIELDNFGSKYLSRRRLAGTFNHNNLTGNDDILSLKYLTSANRYYHLENISYLLPVGHTWEVGLYALNSELELGKEFEATETKGKSVIGSVYVNKYLVSEENLEIRLTPGFDYKYIRNFQLGDETSRDNMRVAKLGLDVDKTDKWGRTIAVNEFSYGIPDFWGSLKAVDERASRTGTGGKFTKWNITLLRLQRVPYSKNMTLLWKNDFQISPYNLAASEQFQIGGIASNRGYPIAEKAGDQGLSSVIELSTPIALIPDSWTLLRSEKKVYDTLRFVAFYDYGHTKLRSPQAGEKSKETLRSAGCGLRFNWPEESLSVRLEFGWPLGQKASDGDDFRTWTRISKSF